MSLGLGASDSLVSMVHNDETEHGGRKCALHVAGKKKRNKKQKQRRDQHYPCEVTLLRVALNSTMSQGLTFNSWTFRICLTRTPLYDIGFSE